MLQVLHHAKRKNTESSSILEGSEGIELKKKLYLSSPFLILPYHHRLTTGSCGSGKLLSGIAHKKEPCTTTCMWRIFPLQCVLKPPYTEKGLQARNISYHCSVSPFFTTVQHLLYISARKCQCVRHSCKIVSTASLSPEVMERTVVRLHKLTSYYALRGRAASSLISLHCTQKKSQQGCQMVWLGNNTPFVRKQFVLRELWLVSRCDA